ncbi:MAG: glycosyltransferase family 39 protein [Candidatus Peribacteraceae bacterium]|nr:glycosyltransferase family 39 protein [Candidatus Peribacteraceae bacterium]MDD5742816.1 glycosyltransferase family 39 protein [Candidatus Peribacteraceae bacterium]
MQKRTIQILSVVLLLGLMLWGGYSTFVYLGVPVHGAVLLDNAAKDVLRQQDCTNAPFFCGVQSLLSTVFFTIGRAGNFFGYAIACVVLLFLGWGVLSLKTGTWRTFRAKGRPVHLLLGFLVLVWLLFTTLSQSLSGGVSFRQIAEPSPLVYTDVSPSVLQALKDNFNELDQRGCLQQIGTYDNGAKAYEITLRCMQQSFITRVLPVFFFVVALFFEFLVLGKMFLRLFRFPALSLLTDVTVSAGVGACAWIAILWFLAVVGLIVSPAVWALVLMVPALAYKDSLYWLRTFIRPHGERDVAWVSLEMVLMWLLLSYLALNFLTIIRPFPIGWDDLGSYLNRPRLMVSYGHFIFSMAPFQWEYLTSFGFALFGYDSVFGATTSMAVNWTAGVLAILAVASFARHFLGQRAGLLSALLFYTLPLIGHFSFADMKIDNAIFAMGALTMFAAFFALFPRGEEETVSFGMQWRWFVLSGLFAGFAFSMKPTAVMVLMATFAVLLGVSLHWVGFFGAVSLAIAAFIAQHALDVPGIVQRISGVVLTSSAVPLTIFIVLGCALLLVAALLRPARLKTAALSVLLFVALVAAAIFPWVYHNNFLRGRIIPTNLELGVPNSSSPDFDIDGSGSGGGGRDYRLLPKELQVDKSLPACKSTGSTEELGRYWGYRIGLGHYLFLPWRSVLNLDSAGYYVTTSPILFLFPLLLLLPFFWMRRGRWLRWLWAATAFLIVQWVFLANGVPWYGIGMFLGLTVCIEALYTYAPDIFSRTIAGILIVIALFCSFGQRLWQFEVQRNMLEYAFGKISAEALQERTVSHYDDIAAAVISRKQTMPDRPYLYRIGTFIPYFIPRNLEIIGISDHQLDFFNCIFSERNPELTLKRLQVLGFNSIVFDTNTATIEKDANGSLHQKVNAFLEFVNARSLGIVPQVNDPDGGIAFVLLP